MNRHQAQLVWMMVNFERAEGITGIHEGLRKPEVFTDEEWELLLTESEKIMQKGADHYLALGHSDGWDMNT